MDFNNRKIREYFKNFFIKNNHKFLESNSLIPNNDKTLLFINSGMAIFKNIFTEIEEPKYKSIVTIQKCLRVDGKHNDIEEVGYSLNHHTFFEMMGNFSFGEYFKEEACLFAFNFLTKELNINKNKLIMTVFSGNKNIEKDEETKNIWKKIGINNNNIIFCDEKSNFWSMGQNGVCGVSTEIHYKEEKELLEIWNIVFMQYEKTNELIKKKNKIFIDTGMGLERICRILQNKKNNYETDLFKPLLKKLKENKIIFNENNINNISIRIIVDHIRAITFLIADGVTPSNEKHGYVLRKLIRRALKYSINLNINYPFLYSLSEVIIKEMCTIYKDLKNNKNLIKSIIKNEEEDFFKIIKNSDKKILSFIKKEKIKILDAEKLFFIYDTFGIPLEITEIICNKLNIEINKNNINNFLKKKKKIK